MQEIKVRTELELEGLERKQRKEVRIHGLNA